MKAAKLCYMNTDNFISRIKTEDIYKVMLKIKLQ